MENEYLKCAMYVVIALILTIGGCTAFESKLVAQLAESGIDPIDAKCAVNNSNSTSICLVRAAIRTPSAQVEAK